MKKDSRDNMKKDLNFQNMLCHSVFYLWIAILLYGL
jgi:hypothetical protein